MWRGRALALDEGRFVVAGVVELLRGASNILALSAGEEPGSSVRDTVCISFRFMTQAVY